MALLSVGHPDDDSHVDADGGTEPQGQIGRAELVAAEESGVVLAARDGSRFEAASYTLVSAMDRVVPTLRAILDRLRTGAHAPDEISMNVGLQVGGETGFVLAKGTTEATIAATVTWRREPEPGPV